MNTRLSVPTFRLLILTLPVLVIAVVIINVPASQARFIALSENRYLPFIAQLWPPPTPTPSPGRLVISEVMVNPITQEPEGEWIEIFNAGDLGLTLNGYKIGDAAIPGISEGMFRLPDGIHLAAGETRVIANHALDFEQKYGYAPDYELSGTDDQIPTLSKYQAWAGEGVTLANSGDEVLVLDKNDQIVDGVGWGNSITIFYPAALIVREGRSLERYPGNRDTNTSADWWEQSAPSPGRVVIPPPSPTPTRTPRPTHTATPTQTPTATATPTHTPTVTPFPVWVINEIHADPHPELGDANGDGQVNLLADEFIELANLTGVIADLSGWRIRTIADTRHIFAPGTILPNGCGMVIFGGGLPSGEFGGVLVQIASSGSLDLINAGDTIQLVDPMGISVAIVEYGMEGEGNQSLTRQPDLTGLTWIQHSQADGSGGLLYSPGTRLDGTRFPGCPLQPGQ